MLLLRRIKVDEILKVLLYAYNVPSTARGVSEYSITRHPHHRESTEFLGVVEIG